MTLVCWGKSLLEELKQYEASNKMRIHDVFERD